MEFTEHYTSHEQNQISYNTYGLKTAPAIILLHGFAETSHMWNPLIPHLKNHYVITLDLPGIGNSSIPDHMNIILAAIQIHDLIESLGVNMASVVGHDIGLMVAYAYTVLYREEVNKLVLMDAFIPGIKGWEEIYNNPQFWHFRFSGPTPELLVKGREDVYFAYFWNKLAANPNRSIPNADRKFYLETYSKPDKMRSAWRYFESFPATAKELERMSALKLEMPVLSIGGDKSLGKALSDQVKIVATNVTTVIVKDAGHWILEEQQEQTINALLKFLL